MSFADNAAFQRAMGALQAGNVKDAERLFKDVLRTQPKHVAALNLLGVVLTQLGKFAEAETYLRLVLQEYPKSDATLYNYGIILKALNRPVEALDRFSQALELNPRTVETWNNRGTVFNDLKRHDEAIADFDKAIGLNPRYAEALYNKGKSLNALGRSAEALVTFENALALKPDLAEARASCGYAYFELKRHSEALAAFERALAIRPDIAEAWLGRGNASSELGRHREALVAYDKALALKPDLAEAKLGRGNALVELKRLDEALTAFDDALALNPDLAQAWLGRGNVLSDLVRPSDALAAYEQALTSKPGLAEAWLGRGHVYAKLRKFDDAFDAYDKALALRPDLAKAWLGRGNVLSDLRRYDETLAAYDRALAAKSDMAEAWYARGHVFNCLQRYKEAIAACDRALALKPDFDEAWVERGDALFALDQFKESLAAYDSALLANPNIAEAWLGRAKIFFRFEHHKETYTACDTALSLRRDLDYVESMRLHAKLFMCDWTDFEAEQERLLSSMRGANRASLPFSNLSIASTPADQLQSARRFVSVLPRLPPLWNGQIRVHDRIRIAYMSSDLRDHAVGYLTVGLFEHHDRSRFDVTAISFGANRDSDFRRRVRAPFERIVDIGSESDQEIADLIRQLEIDILVDLNGFTRNWRAGVFARRPARVQVNYLGYAGTLGTDCFDYILADSTVIPGEHFDCYSEKVVWLPDTFLVNDDARHVADRIPARSELGLPEKDFVFCCFNQSYKINPAIFEIWMRLLKAVDGSVLWLKDNDAVSSGNLRLEAERRGVAPERLTFATHAQSAEDHLARQRQADLFLDTLPYNAHTTAADALWVGVPVLTCLGSTFAGRVAASLVRAVGLPDLVTESLEDYEALALKLAREPALLTSLKAKLVRNRGTFPLFDTARFARNIEAAYRAMYERSQRGEPPAHLAVKDAN